MNRYSLRRIVGTGLTAAALSMSAVAVAAPAGAADTGTTADTGARHHRLHLTDTQKQCMKDHGITRPIRPLTPEKITALKAAAKACDIELPTRRSAPQN